MPLFPWQTCADLEGLLSEHLPCNTACQEHLQLQQELQQKQRQLQQQQQLLQQQFEQHAARALFSTMLDARRFLLVV